jgi:hypothetical protein
MTWAAPRYDHSIRIALIIIRRYSLQYNISIDGDVKARCRQFLMAEETAALKCSDAGGCIRLRKTLDIVGAWAYNIYCLNIPKYQP